MRDTFINYINQHKYDKSITLYYDLETFLFNIDNVLKYGQPTEYKAEIFSLAVYFENESTYYSEKNIVLYNDFKKFFIDLFKGLSNEKGKILNKSANIKLIAHNCNKFDTHFLKRDLEIYYPNMIFKNAYVKNAVENINTIAKKEITKDQKNNGIFIEKRIKSSNNLSADFYLNNVFFECVDTLPKVNTSLGTLGEKLLTKKLIEEKYTKTVMDYEKYNKHKDMTVDESKKYSQKIFNQLDVYELRYIKNDVILLFKACHHYNDLYPNFDFNAMTLTKNIGDYYIKDSPLTELQLYGKIKDLNIEVNYTNYTAKSNKNLYEYFRPFYFGGLNIYNPKYLAKIIKRKIKCIDINSSYPYVLYNFLVPTFLYSYNFYKKETEIERIDQNNDKFFTIYEMSYDTFNNDILYYIDSTMIKKMLVKYYLQDKTNTVNVTTYTLKLIEKFINKQINHIKILSQITYTCVPFGAKDKILDCYKIKSESKCKFKMNMVTPFDYTIDYTQKNNSVFTQGEIDLSKVYLNGVYGIPALRAFFNLFRIRDDQEIYNIKNGFKNNERNIITSIFVTSCALNNLLTPLTYLTAREIDDYFYYADTDSLYLDDVVFNKIPADIFDDWCLGKWSVDAEIEKMYILNHKKYAYQKTNEKDIKIVVKSGGIPLKSFNTNYDNFDEFIDNEFYDGKPVKTLRNIYTKTKVIAIYNSITNIKKGYDYQTYFSDYVYNTKKEMIIEISKEIEKNDLEDYMFIETPLGTISQRDLNKAEFNNNQLINISSLTKLHKKIKYLLTL